MDAVTYPDPKVIAFINCDMIAVRVAFDCQALSETFTVKWTPTLIILDGQGKEHHRSVGFLAPDELIPMLLLGMAKSCFATDRIDDTLKHLEKLLREYPVSGSAPEALYLRGVALYKTKHEPRPLKDAYEQLAAKYPASEWAKRAYPYRLL